MKMRKRKNAVEPNNRPAKSLRRLYKEVDRGRTGVAEMLKITPQALIRWERDGDVPEGKRSKVVRIAKRKLGDAITVKDFTGAAA